MTQTYKFTDPTNNNQLFETYSTEYVDNLETGLNNTITQNNQLILQQVAGEISTINNTISTLNTTLVNSINDMRTDLTQYIDNTVTTIENTINDITVVINEITDGTGEIDVTNITTENINVTNVNTTVIEVTEQLTVTNGTLVLNNTNIVYDYNAPGDIINVKNITFMPAGSIDLNGGTITNVSNPINNTDIVNKYYVDQAIASVDVSAQIAGLLKTDGSNAMTNNLNVGNYRVINVATPVVDTDAATKAYVDSAIINPAGTYLPLAGGAMVIGATITAQQGSIVMNQTSGALSYPNISMTSGNNAYKTIVQPNMIQTGSINVNTIDKYTPAGQSASYINVNKSLLLQQGTSVVTITNTPTPVNTSDIVPKSYVDQYIPTGWTTTNTLVLVNDLTNSIQSVTSRQLSANSTGSPFATFAALTAGPYYYRGSTVTPAEHDTAVVLADESATGIYANGQTLHKYDGTVWEFLYGINETPFTPAQNAAINSGVTSAIVNQVATNQNAITNLTNSVNDASTTAQNALPLTGGTMQGVIDLAGNSLDRVRQITDNNGDQLNIYASGGVQINGYLSMSSNNITNLGTPTQASDATTKAYVDARSFTSVTITSTDPGVNSTLATGAIVLVYTP